MSKPSPARYRTTNWSSYTASLRRCGSLLIWLDKDMPPKFDSGGPDAGGVEGVLRYIFNDLTIRGNRFWRILCSYMVSAQIVMQRWKLFGILHSLFTRVTENGGRRYLQIVASFRNEVGKPRLRVVANIGRVDEVKDGQFDALIRGLSWVAGRVEPATTDITYEAALGFGDVFALHELWKDLGFDRALRSALRSGRRQIDAEALIRAMVFNRLCAPDSKLECLRWLETVAMPAMPEGVTH